MSDFEGLTQACGAGLPPGAPCNTHELCAGCTECPCHRSSRMGWWTLSGEDFLAAMKRAQAGEDPDMIYAEYFANAQIDGS